MCFAMLVALVFSFGTTNKNIVFAATTVAPEQEIEITVSIGRKMAKAGTQVCILYDITKFNAVGDSLVLLTPTDLDTGGSVIFTRNPIDHTWIEGQIAAVTGKTGTQITHKINSKVTITYDGVVEAFKFKVKALSAVAVDDETFDIFCSSTDRDVYFTYSIIGGSSEPPAQAAPYTVTPTRADSSDIQAGGENFGVDVRLTRSADADDGVASVQGLLSYDKTLVAPVLSGGFPDGVTVTQYEEGLLKISRRDITGGVGDDGLLIATVPFTPLDDGDAVFSISGEDGFELEVSLSGDPPAIAAAPGNDLTVTIAEAQSGPQISFDADYAGLPTGYTLLKYEVPEKPTVKWTYGADGPEMHYALIGGKHFLTYIVENTVTGDSAEVPTETANAVTANDGDLNGNGRLQIADAQIAGDLANDHNNYTDDTDFTHLSIAARLKADVNNDGAVTDADAAAIQHRLHYGAWE
jgi:hypothetical protein